jgi:hypothetical protein
MQGLKKLRRLYDIKPENVSIVDKAANLRTFIIMKRKDEGEGNMDEIKDIMKKIEKALNDINGKLDSQDISIADGIELVETEVKKKGAKFSSATLASLRSLKETLSKLIDEDAKSDTETEKSLSKDEIIAAISKGIESSIAPEEKKEVDISAIIAKAITDAIKSITPEK